MKKAAICGGSGEVGQALYPMLKELGYWPKIYYKVYAPGGQHKNYTVEHYIFDLTNDAGFYGSFQWNQFDVVFQLAKPSSDATAVEKLVQPLKINMNVLEACKLFKVKRVLTVLNGRCLETVNTIERLYAAYAKECDLQAWALWPSGSPTDIASQLVAHLNQFDKLETTS